MTSVPAADVEGAVLDHLQKLLAAPELVARTWAAAKRESEDEITEHEVTCLLTDCATIWNELFPAEQARIVQLLVERVGVQEDALEVRSRAEGLASLVGELRQSDERTAIATLSGHRLRFWTTGQARATTETAANAAMPGSVPVPAQPGDGAATALDWRLEYVAMARRQLRRVQLKER